MPWQPNDDPACRAAKELLRSHRQQLRDFHRDAGDHFVDHVQATAEEFVQKQLRGDHGGGGRANLERYEAAFEYLNSQCGYKLSYMQKELYKVARLILVKRIFGSDLESEWHYIKLRLGVERLYEQAAITLPRRSGKTVVQTILAAVVAATQPDGNVCCFNLGSRQSVEWLAQVLGVLHEFKGSPFDWKLKKIDSTECIRFINCVGTEVIISSYPGPRDANASNYRGMGSKLMLLLYDEFYFFPEVVYTTTLPLSRNGAAILMISSMSKDYDNNTRRMIMNKMDDGQDLFLRLDWIRACPLCVEKGCEKDCNHNEPRPSHFEPRGAQRRQRALISPFGKENYERELLNMAARATKHPVFQPGWLEPLRQGRTDFPPQNHDPHVPLSPYNEFFVGVDPAGDGFSRMAIVSVIFDTAHRPPGCAYRCLVAAAEVVPKRIIDIDAGDMIVNHVLRVRAAIPQLAHATAVICIENNSILVPQSLVRSIKANPRAQNMGYMTERVGGKHGGGTGTGATTGTGTQEMVVRAGTRTTNRSKEAIVGKLTDLLIDGALGFHARFLVPHPESQPRGEETVADSKRLFVDELAGMHMEFCRGTGPQASQERGVIKYRGYNAQTGGRSHDDKFMALGFTLQCMPLYKANPALFARIVQPGAR